MVTVPIAFVVALIASLALTPWVRKLALAVGSLDRASESSRRVHTGAVPRLGGLAIIGAFYLPLAALLVLDSEVGRYFRQDMSKVLGLFAGGLAIATLGVYDDLRGANAPKKFLVQFGVALALYAVGFRISSISTPFGFAIELGLLSLPVTVLWVVGVINAVNLIDGLDGLAAGIACLAAGATLVVAAINHNVLMMLFMAALAGATLGFLAFNFNPASIFMGDTGSMFLGFVLAVTSVQTNTKGPATVAMLAPVLAIGLPIMDTALAMARRYLRGQSMFQADREHIHHRLLGLGLSHRNAVLVLYALSLFFGVVAAAVTVSNGPQTAGILAATVAVVVVLVRRLGYLNIAGFAKEGRRQRRHNLDVRRAVRDAGAAMSRAAGPDEVRAALAAVCAALDLHTARLIINAAPALADGRSFDWTAPGPLPLAAPFTSRHDVSPDAHLPATLEATWRDGRTAMNRDDEIALDLLADHLAAALARLAKRPEPAKRTAAEVS